MLDHIVESLVPVAFVILLGFIAGKRRKLSHSDSLLITRLVLNWIFPSLLLAGMASTPQIDKSPFSRERIISMIQRPLLPRKGRM